jgi:hypothetical protein
MSTSRSMTRSPKALARMALRVARKGLPAYSSKFSKRDFSQHQLLAMLALKHLFRTDYRGIIAILEDTKELQKILRLSKIPHFTTLQKAHERLLKKGLLNDFLQPFSVSPRSAA